MLNETTENIQGTTCQRANVPTFERFAGALITFSGLDGAGKSTQIDLLMDHLRQQGRRPRYLWTRGGYTPGFERLKAWGRRTPGRAVPPSGHTPQRTRAFSRGWVRRLWLTLALLDLLWVYGVQVRWWLWRGQTVVCDRYLGDTRVDFRLNFPQEHVERWWLWRALAWVTPRPDVAFVLLVPVAESVRRSDNKGEPFRDSPEVLAQRLAQYRALAAEHDDWHVLDGRRPISELAAEILTALNVPTIERSSAFSQKLTNDIAGQD
jgi:dTMP kinase